MFLYTECARDVYARLDYTINLLLNRAMEHNDFRKRKEERQQFITDIESISGEAKSQVVYSLLDVYKIQHTSQIIRWTGMVDQELDEDSWESTSTALEKRLG